MKKIMLLLLLFPLCGWGTFGGMQGTQINTSECSTPAIGTTLNEGFVGTGYENSWTESGSTVDEDFTLSGSPPANSCAEGLNVNTSASDAYTYWDNGSAMTRAVDMDFIVEIYVNSVTLDTDTYVTVLSWDDDTSFDDPGVGGLRIRNVSGTYKFVGRGYTTTLSFDISTGTWLTVTMHLDATAASSYFQCAGCSDETQKAFTRKDTVDGRYFGLGAPGSIDAGESLDIEYGRVYINVP